MPRRALVLPGRRFGPYAPLTFYGAMATQRRGADVTWFEWLMPSVMDPRDDAQDDSIADWVVEQVADRLVDAPVILAKSLGTYAAELAAAKGLPAVWFTPLLHSPRVLAGLRAATAPFLLIGGTEDFAWRAETARELTPYVCEVDGGDHGLIVPGPLAFSAEALGRVASAIESFLDDVVWPG